MADRTLVAGAGLALSEATPGQAILTAEVTQAELDAEAATRAAADTALDTRVDALEAAPPAHTHAQSDVTGLVADLAAKAPLASPALTGTPTAPTQAPGDNSTKLATTAYVEDAVAAVSGGGGPPTGAAGGVLGGTYPNPSFAADMATQAELDASVAALATVALPFVFRDAEAGDAIDLGPMPFAGTLTAWALRADATGDVTVDVRLGAAHPATTSVTGTGTPEIAADDAADGDVSDWTDTTVAVGDMLRAEVTAVATITRLTLLLTLTRTT